MSEQIKFIVDQLNGPPFNKNFNLISFDSLQPINLLQILNDVITQINYQEASDLREEDPEQRVLRMLNFLRIMKYKPKIENVSAFRQGLVQGDKSVVYPIIQWLLENLKDLKKRAYLARYLVKVDIPQDMFIDNEVTETHSMYLELIEQFKELHKESEQIKETGVSAAEVKKDILAMEEEQDQLRKRITRVKKRVDAVANKDKLMLAAKQLRQEREKEANLIEQKQTQKSQMVHTEQKLNRLQVQLKDLRSSAIGITPEGLIKRLEEENQVNLFLTKEKFPKEINAKKNYLSTLQKVADEPAMGQNEIDALNKKIKILSTETNSLVEKRMARSDPTDDKISVFRQQAAVIANKKNSAAESLQDAMDEYNSVESDFKEKREKLKDTDGVEILKGEEFKRYVNKLRGKSTLYKKKRLELSEIQAEIGVLSRTKEILQSKDEQTQAFLSNLEAKHGVSGFHNTKEELEKVSTIKSELDEQKGKTLEDISKMVVQLTNTIAQKKNSLAPIIVELRPLRQQCQEMTIEYDERKSVYETTAAGLESNISKLDQEVRGSHEDVLNLERKFHQLNAMIEITDLQMNRIEEEMKLYVLNNSTKKSYRDQYTQKIHEQEVLGKSLKEQQKYVRESHGPNLLQMKMWSDLLLLMKAKKTVSDQNVFRDQSPTHYEQDHLVL